MGVSGISEVPSATSSATLGSAAMEYPPAELIEESAQAARRRRYMTAAILSVSVAAGVVGLVLIISTAILKKNDARVTGGPGASQTTAPAEAIDPASLGNGTGTTSGASNGDPPVAPTPTPTAPPVASATTTTAPIATPTPAPTFAPTSNTAFGGGGGAAAQAHRTPPPVVAPPPKPSAKPPSAGATAKSPDRGF